jgi:hypothetical protein
MCPSGEITGGGTNDLTGGGTNDLTGGGTNDLTALEVISLTITPLLYEKWLQCITIH